MVFQVFALVTFVIQDVHRSIAPLQAKFFEALIIPLFRELAAVFPEPGRMLKGAMANRDAWEANGGIVPPV